MSFYLQIRERSSPFLLQYIQLSPEKLVRTVTRILARYAFQTTKGNAHHLHIVLFTEESNHSYDMKRKIRVSSTPVFLTSRWSSTVPTQTSPFTRTLMHLLTKVFDLLTHSFASCSHRRDYAFLKSVDPLR